MENGTVKKVHPLIEKVYHPVNLKLAWEIVRANKGSKGIDKVGIPSFERVANEELLKLHKELLRCSIYNEEEVRKLLHILFTLFDVADTFATDCQLAIGSPMKDYEDAIIVQTAVRIGADCIVTRNVKDYKLAVLPVFSPEEFLAKIPEESAHAEESLFGENPKV